jgi:hypothetical protein
MCSKDLLKLFLLTRNRSFFNESLGAAASEHRAKVQAANDKLIKGPFDLNKVDDCKSLFRFEKSEIIRLVKCFRLPEKITISQQDRVTFSGTEGMIVNNLLNIFVILNPLIKCFELLQQLCV